VKLNVPARTPYDGSSTPFTIGLKPLDLLDWIEVDDKLAAYIAEKDRLYAARPQDIFAEVPDTRKAQHEVLELVADHVVRRFPATYRRRGNTIDVAGIGQALDISDATIPPLQTASRLVQEDLVLMRKAAHGWTLAAASLCFPSSWSLREKFGRPLQDIHAPVPQFGPGTRTARLITRILDNLKADQPVWRMNWSLQGNGRLYQPMSSLERDQRALARPVRFSAARGIAGIFLRVERQTLRRLPASGDILFTIRIHLDPMAALREHPHRSELAASFAAQLEALDRAQLDYKGLTADRDRLAAMLRAAADDWTSS
jgi:hypothetical protein